LRHPLWRTHSHTAKRSDVSDRLLPRVVDEDLVPGLHQPPRHVRAHIAETNEADVHDAFSLTYFAFIVAGMNSARTLSVCWPSAGTGPYRRDAAGRNSAGPGKEAGPP